MARLRLSIPARRDLVRHWTHIAADSAANADRWRERLLAQMQLLAGQPLIAEACPHLRPNLRRFGIGNYVIYYEPRSYGI